MSDGRIVPRLKQRKDGNWTCKVDKQTINLKTKTYSIARERAKEAVYEGKRDFGNEQFYDTSAPASAPSAVPSGDWQSDLSAAASSGIVPDQYMAPNGSAVPLLNPMESGDAPPASAPHTPDSGAKAEDPNSTHIPPEMFAGMMGQLAHGLVEGQIRLQEWLLARGLKMKAGPVPMNDKGREIAVQFWSQQLAKWVPEDVPLPEWASAMVACGMFCTMTQLQGATPIEKPPTTAPNPDYNAG